MRITQEWIANLAAGKSFVDVGGLLRTKNERVSDAMKAGASSATMADIQPEDSQMWRDFDAHCAAMGLSGYRKVVADLMAPDASEIIGQHDLVHCSGIIYHMPDPVGCLRSLRAITREHLILVSMVVPERIETSVGTLNLYGGSTLFVPALGPRQHAILHEYFTSTKTRVHSITGADVPNWTRPDGSPLFGPWWWLFTPRLLRNMISISGFEVLEHAPVVKGRSHGFLCRRV